MSGWILTRGPEVLAAALLLPAAIGLGLAASQPQWQGLLLAAVAVPLAAGFSGLRTAGLASAYLVLLHFIHLLKRAVFLLGPQPQVIYFGVQLFPTAILVVLFASAARKLRETGLPVSGKLLLAYFALALATTMSPAADVNWDRTLAAIHQQLLPFCLFFVGLTLTLDELARLGRRLALLACLSMIYGLWQLVSGPTWVDRAWAAETYAYSIHGAKVLAYMGGISREFRVFSYYADPLTWGLFLVAALAAAAAARALGRLGRPAWLAVNVAVLTGLFLSMTRTAWAGLLVTVGTCWLLKGRLIRRPWLLFSLVIGAFVLAALGGEYLYREIFLARRVPITGSFIANRYLTVGTVEARMSAFQSLVEAAEAAPAVGKGYGLIYDAARGPAASPSRAVSSSHNFLVELVLATGIPGALLFLAFYLQWLREGLRALGISKDRGQARAIRWLAAFSAGFIFTGYLNGLTFMTHEFFLILGVLAAHARKTPEAVSSSTVLIPACQRYCWAGSDR